MLASLTRGLCLGTSCHSSCSLLLTTPTGPSSPANMHWCIVRVLTSLPPRDPLPPPPHLAMPIHHQGHAHHNQDREEQDDHDHDPYDDPYRTGRGIDGAGCGHCRIAWLHTIHSSGGGCVRGVASYRDCRSCRTWWSKISKSAFSLATNIAPHLLN